MTDLATEIAEYARNVCRANKLRPCKRLELIEDIMREAQINKAWPKATVKQWELAIMDAKKRGLLDTAGETVWIPAKELEVKPTQKGLFDEC
jgi:hypothetical protein